MLKFEVISLFNCQLCHRVLTDPVILPCGETVCKAHSEEIGQDTCKLCSATHSVPKEGFLANKMVRNQLELQLNKLNFNFSQFNDYKGIIEDLNKQEVETMEQDPENYIYEYYNELIRQVDVRRETLFEGIQK